MAIFPIGNQRIGVVTETVTYPPPYYEPVPTETVLYWDGCALEMQTVSEQQGQTVTTSELAVVCGPVAGTKIPTVTAAGVAAPMDVDALTANLKLRCDGRTYVMRGDAVLQVDIRGNPDHVECRCEREAT